MFGRTARARRLCVFLILLVRGWFCMAMEQQVPQYDRYGCRILKQPRRPLPPPTWYAAIGVRPVEKLIGVENCYAVVRVEHGFEEGRVGGRYVVVTILFKEPTIVVESRMLSLADVNTEQAAAIYGLWRGFRRVEAYRIRGIIEKVLKTEKQTFYYEKGSRVLHLARDLNYWGIGTLPAVEITDEDSPLPLIFFRKSVDAEGNTVWLPGMARGGRYDGGIAPWRFTVVVAKGASVHRWSPTNEIGFRHEFTVEHPLSINDVRYEKLLLVVARVSPMLASVLSERYAHLEARRKELARLIETVKGRKRNKSRPEGERQPSAPETGLDVDMIKGPKWSATAVAVTSAIGGMVFGACCVLVILRVRKGAS